MKPIFFLLFILMAGCKVGPNYRVPETPMPEAYSEQRNALSSSIEEEDLTEWWKIFGDPCLDQLLEEVLDNSFDYRIALAQLIQARSLFWVQFAQIFPEIDGDALGSRFRTSKSFASAAVNNPLNSVSPIQDFFLLSLDMIWEIDIFGKLRRSATASYAIWEATVEEVRGVKITVLSEAASIYMAIRALQQKLEIYSQLLNADRDLLSLAQARFEAGLADAQTVEGYRAALDVDQAAELVLQTSLKQGIYSLAILVGKLPETLLVDFEVPAPLPYAVGTLPDGAPADLLRRRPDIRSAERQLAAATEQIGVAVADLFPQVSLTGSSSSFAANPLQGANVGFASDRLSHLLKSPSRIWGYGLFVTFPVLDFGKRIAGVQVQESLEHQAYLNYQKTVVAALQETEQALVAYFNEEERYQNLQHSAEANQRMLGLDAALFESGLADAGLMLQARQAWLTSVNASTDSQLTLMLDLIALYKAMGGDW